LFTVGTSTCPVDRSSLHHEPAEAIGMQLPGLTHAFAAYEYLADCDIIHDHSLAGASLAAAGWSQVPVVTTIHGPFSPGLAELYRWIAPRIPLVAISADQASRAPTGVRIARVIHHGIDLDTYQARTDPAGSGGYLLCLARMSPTKGIDIAIRAARQAGRRLVIAAKMREPAEHAYYHNVVEPLLDGSITYVGEADTATKHDLLRRADALLNPIQWPEPFGLVMIEALACGTPVIATPNGAAPEIIIPGINGWLAGTPRELVDAINHTDGINRRQCRRDAVTRFSLQTMTRQHETLYQSVLTTPPNQNGSTPPTLVRPSVTDDRGGIEMGEEPAVRSLSGPSASG
jgi:glycosyltransferase involved in cell wall biosynthesis